METACESRRVSEGPSAAGGGALTFGSRRGCLEKVTCDRDWQRDGELVEGGGGGGQETGVGRAAGPGDGVGWAPSAPVPRTSRGAQLIRDPRVRQEPQPSKGLPSCHRLLHLFLSPIAPWWKSHKRTRSEAAGAAFLLPPAGALVGASWAFNPPGTGCAGRPGAAPHPWVGPGA